NSSCCSRRWADSPLATVSRGEWSVRATHSCPRSRAAAAISLGGLPPSDQSEWVWQSPRRAARNAVGTGGGGPAPRPAPAAGRRRGAGGGGGGGGGGGRGRG